MTVRKPPNTRPLRLPARPPGHASTYYEDEEIDEIESLARDAEHDQDESDPDPERYPTPSEHAQEQRTCRERPMRPTGHSSEHPGR